MKTFGETLKDIRTATGHTQKDIAEHLGLSHRAYQSYELNAREPNLKVLSAIADYYNVSVDYLLCRSKQGERFTMYGYKCGNCDTMIVIDNADDELPPCPKCSVTNWHKAKLSF